MPTFKFRVILDSVKEEDIFRDVIIDDSDNFESLYQCILKSFEFEDKEMASFYVSDHEWNKGQEIALMDMSYDEDDESQTDIMQDTLIKHHVYSPNQRFILVHDFMDMWIFLLELQEVLSETTNHAKTIFSVGTITESLKKKKVEQNEILQFTSDEINDENAFEFDDGYDDEDFEDLLNIDEYDI